MDRRACIRAVACSLALTPFAIRAQPAKLPRIGFLDIGSPTTYSAQLDAFRRSLRELGWIEGQTLTIEYRWAEGDPNRLPTLVTELVQIKVDVIVLSGTPSMRAAQRATSTIPVVLRH
jgi:putative ABC transport system substrate-binding protein